MKTKNHRKRWNIFIYIVAIICTYSCSHENKPPVCEITTPAYGDIFSIGDDILINANASDPDNDIQEVYFYKNQIGLSVNTNEPYSVTWNTSEEVPGQYTIKTVAFSDDGDNAVDEIDVFLEKRLSKPVAGFSATPVDGTAPLQVVFSDESENDPVSWLWRFGDGDSSTYQNPSHIYRSAGEYTVTLKVKNSIGEDILIMEHLVKVSNNPGGDPPVAGFSASPTSGKPPLEVEFSDESSLNPTAWLWGFGDGATSQSPSPSHIYTTPGTYSVTLSISNNNGADFITKENIIVVGEEPEAPDADFIASSYAAFQGEDIIFTDISSNNPELWLWNFGDGSTSNEQNPTHKYIHKGRYTVSLTVTNSVGTDTEVKEEIINITSVPVADFTVSPISGNKPLIVTFTNNSYYAETFLWDFGDGNTSTQENPMNVYQNTGTYDVTLTVSNQLGEDILTKESLITVDDPCPSLVDIDGNVYRTVLIGTQCWMAENLKVTKYPDGTDIPHIEDDDEWAALEDVNTADGYCYVNNDPDSDYGVLYTYGTAIAKDWTHDLVDAQGICPDGWHIPTRAEWFTLTGFLGEDIAGGVLKEVGFEHWLEPNRGATDERDFTALPAGYRLIDTGEFSYIGEHGSWWGAKEAYNNQAFKLNVVYDRESVSSVFYFKSLGNGVRCIRNL